MAHYAEISPSNVVLRVIVVSGDDKEEWCQQTYGGRWLRTSYNGNIRGNYAGEGMIYDEERDAFLYPQPFPSWKLGPDHKWHPPVPMPEDKGILDWNEETLAWDRNANSAPSVSEEQPEEPGLFD